MERVRRQHLKTTLRYETVSTVRVRTGADAHPQLTRMPPRTKNWEQIARELSSGEDSDAHDELNVMSVQKNAHKVAQLLHAAVPGLEQTGRAAFVPSGMNRLDRTAFTGGLLAASRAVAAAQTPAAPAASGAPAAAARPPAAPPRAEEEEEAP